MKRTLLFALPAAALVVALVGGQARAQAEGEPAETATELAAGKLYGFAEDLYKDELFDLAADQYGDFVRRFPDHKLADKARFRQGRALFRAGSYAQALHTLENYRTSVGDDADDVRESMLFYLGESAFNLGQVNRAREYYALLRDKYPRSNFLKLIAAHSNSIGLQLGIRSYKKGDYEKATEMLADLIENENLSDDDETEARKYLGYCFFEQGEYERAIPHLEFFVTHRLKGEEAENARYRLGVSLYREEQYSLVIPHFEWFIERRLSGPRVNDARYHILWALYRMDQYERAYRYGIAHKLFETNYRDVDGRLEDARVALQTRDFKKARELTEPLLAQLAEDNRLLAALRIFASAAWGLRDSSAAMESLARLVQVFPDSQDSVYSAWRLGKLYFEDGRYGDAIAVLNHVMVKDPQGQYGDASLLLIARSYYEAGDYNRARAAFIDLLQKYPDSELYEGTQFLLARAQMKALDFGEAVQIYRSYLANFPQGRWRRQAGRELIVALRRVGDIPRAVEAAKAYLAAWPNEPDVEEVTWEMARDLFDNGDWSGAVDVYREYVTKWGGGTKGRQARLNIGLAYGYAGERDKARDEFNRLAKEEKKSREGIEALYHLGRLEQERDDLPRALDYYKRFAEKAPSDAPELPRALWTLGKTNYEKERFDDAFEYFDRLRTAFPEHPYDTASYYAKHYTARNDYRKLIELSARFWSNKPEDMKVAANPLDAAREYQEAGRYRQAREILTAFENRFTADKEGERALFLLAKGYFEQRRDRDARRHLDLYRKALPGGEYLPRLNIIDGLLAAREGEDKKAIAYLSKADYSGVEPAFAFEALYTLAYVYLGLGMELEAVEIYERIAATPLDFPGDEVRKLTVGTRLQIAGRYDEAVSVFQKVIAHTNDKQLIAESLDRIGETYQAAGKTREALTEYLKVAYVHNTDEHWALTARFKAGQLYADLCRIDNAVTLWGAVARAAAGDSRGEYARKMIAEANGRRGRCIPAR